MGLLCKRAGKFSNTPFAGRYLQGAEAAVIRPAYDAWNRWGALAASLTTGWRPKTEQPFATDRAQAQRLLAGLQYHAERIAPHLLDKLSLAGCRTLLDVGGGLGTFAAAFCRRYPALRATLVEHPNIIPLTRKALRDSRMTKQIRLIGLDFSRQQLPRGFDAVLASNILHARGAAANRRLLAELYRCLNAGGQLILRDVFLDGARTAPEWGTLFSVSLLLHTPHGRCYALEEIVGWLRQAGFSSISAPRRSSPLPFDPDSLLIADKR